VLSLHLGDGSRDISASRLFAVMQIDQRSIMIAHIVLSLAVTLILGIVFSALAE
jgi:hypothetical protein